MSEKGIIKTVQALLNGDTKTFEDEFIKLDKDDKNSIIKFDTIVKFIFAKNDIESLHIFIDNFNGSYESLDGWDIVYLVDNNQWEMLAVIHHSRVFGKLTMFYLLHSSNVCAIDKFIEYGFITRSELEDEVKNIKYQSRSFTIEKELRKRYPEYVTKEYHITTLENMYLDDFDTDIFNELFDMIDNDYDGSILTKFRLNLDKYNKLVQKVPNETIIENTVKSMIYDFDPALIDVIGIRLRLQAHIDVEEAKEHSNTFASYEVIRYSGLNFHKNILLKSLKEMNWENVLKIFEWLPTNYFSEQGQNDCYLRFKFSKDTIKLLIKLGYKIFDTPENREEFSHNYHLYGLIPKH